MKWSSTLLLLFVSLPSIYSFGFSDSFPRSRRISPSSESATVRDANLLGSAFIYQKLDHFDSGNTNTWRQRYFFNIQKQASDINILYVGADQTADIVDISGENNVIYGYAKQFSAGLYELEHRFIGQSRPTNDTSLNNLQFLTSQQAIEDLAEFIRQINAQSSTKRRWIAIGSLYGGSLALWLRQQYPDLVIGAFSSSAPLLAQVDFYGFFKTVEDDITAVGGDCGNQIGQALDTAIQYMRSDDGRRQLDTLFQLNPGFNSFSVITETMISQFYHKILDGFLAASLYGGTGNFSTIQSYCQVMTQQIGTEGPIDRLARVSNNYGDPTNINYTSIVEYYRMTGWDNQIIQSNDRAYFYLMCNEFGWFRSTDMKNGIFRSVFPVNWYLNGCYDVFGWNFERVKNGIDRTNAYYGERNYYKGTNVVITRGTNDAWGFLTKKDTQHESVVVYSINGGRVSSDLQPPCTSSGVCNQAVNTTQALTALNFQNWINAYDFVPNNITIRDRVGLRPLIYGDLHPAPLTVDNNNPMAYVVNGRFKRSVSQEKKKPAMKRNVFTGRSHHGLLVSPPPMGEKQRSWPPNIQEGYVQQVWDHFDNTNANTFKQRFFVNEMGNSSSPNFLMIGGEGPESSSWVTNEDLAWLRYAKAIGGANLFLLEHRYYGKSKLGTNNLNYLTSAQMLYDVAEFIRIAKKERQSTGPWITFGGSYSGALSAWAREWFPELILGAVASSGPVEAKNDFPEYLLVVQKVLRNYNTDCAAQVQAAFDKLFQLSITPYGRQQISDKFRLSPPWNQSTVVSPLDMQETFSNIYGYFQGAIQYSNDNNRLGVVYNVSTLCSIMTDGRYRDPLDAVRAVQVWQDGMDNTTTTSSFNDDINSLADMKNYIDGSSSKYDDGDLAGILWTWQTCNEFGYYQTTDYGYGLFGNPVPLNFFVEMCSRVFGTTMDHLEKGVGRSIYQYGGRRRYKATNVVLPNGDSDPWHALGLLPTSATNGLDASVAPILINGTAHCADMYPPRDADVQSLIDARSLILAHIQSWITGGPVPTGPVPVDSSSTASVATTVPSGSTSAATNAPLPEVTTESSSSFFSLLNILLIAIFYRNFN